MVYTNLLYVWAMLNCFAANPANTAQGKFKDLDDYKQMTAYIIEKNYHSGFKKSIVLEKANVTDRKVLDFLKAHKIIAISVVGKIEASDEYVAKHLPDYRDSLIEYQYSFVPIFGKKRSLTFDFSSRPPEKSSKGNGFRKLVLEKGIYYTVY